MCDFCMGSHRRNMKLPDRFCKKCSELVTVFLSGGKVSFALLVHAEAEDLPAWANRR